MERSKYIVFVNYDGDAERKRVEYLLSKWRSRGKVERPKGINAVMELDRGEMEEFLRELLSKLEGDPKEKVRVFRGREIEPSVDTIKKSLEYELREDPKVVEKLIDYVMVKLNATRKDASGRVYDVYTRKGKATIEVAVSGTGGRCSVKFLISGYGEAVDFLASKIDDEFGLFAGG
ncbi:MAG: hypothetical protein GXO14_00915 [Thermococci archaeon]|nr:hypothetical protein [Thermococci archaeon]